MNELVSALCCTYGRPYLLEEAIKCFQDQYYDNKELIILNDQVNVKLKLKENDSRIKIINHSIRFNSLGEKRNYIKSLANGEYFFIWDDDDLFLPWRIGDSVSYIKNNKCDIVKGISALSSINNENYNITSNLFHSQACISKEYMLNNYPSKSVGEDMDFEGKAKILSFDVSPYFWYVYRWGLNTHHLSGITDEKQSWEKSIKYYESMNGEIILEPKFSKNHWEDVYNFLKTRDVVDATVFKGRLDNKH